VLGESCVRQGHQTGSEQHEEERTEHERTTAQTIDQCERDEHTQQIPRPNHSEREDERIRHARISEDLRSVEDDRVDTGQLVRCGEDQTDEHPANILRREEIRPALLLHC
jgi:hypothetical protein